MSHSQQLNFFEDNQTRHHHDFKRNDIRIGEAGEDLAASKLKMWNYTVHRSSGGGPSDLLVEAGGGLLRVQIKTTTKVSNSMTFSYSRGFHGSKDGVFRYASNDFDIAGCVNLNDGKVLFSAGVPEKAITWPRHIFMHEGAEHLSWINAVNEIKKQKAEGGLV